MTAKPTVKPDTAPGETSPSGKRKPGPKHKGVQARSVVTRSRLVDAAIECLWELGYARCSISEITRRAGLTHGAHLHHFGTREELIAAAVDALFQRVLADFEARFSNLPRDMPERASVALDHFRDMALGQLFGVVSELLNAARTDPEMARQMRGYAVTQRALQRRMYAKVFGEEATTDPEILFWLDATFAIFLRGLSLLQTTRTPRDIESTWQTWKSLTVESLTSKLVIKPEELTRTDGPRSQ